MNSKMVKHTTQCHTGRRGRCLSEWRCHPSRRRLRSTTTITFHDARLCVCDSLKIDWLRRDFHSSS